MAKEAIWKADVELFTKTEQLNMIESALRVRVCSVYEMQMFTAKIKFWPDCDSSHPSVFGTCHAYEKPWSYVGNKVINLHHLSLASNTIGSIQCFNNPAFATQTPSASVFKFFQKKIRSLTFLQVEIILMSKFYLVQNFGHHKSRQLQPISNNRLLGHSSRVWSG